LIVFVISQSNSTDANIVQEVSRDPLVVSTPIVPTREETRVFTEEYFKDEPILIDIARCESHFMQFNKDGSMHRGRVNDQDVGVMQINEYFHLETSIKKGYDIYTIEGNLAYARDLYEREGTQPWSSSKPCWGSSEHLAKE
jgi:hypothetical protein